MNNEIVVIHINTGEPRRARATKRGKIHYAHGNMSLCLQFVGDNEILDKDVDCKRCISKYNKSK